MLADELSSESREEIIERLARRVCERGLEGVAVLFLELNKPLAFLGGQAMLVAAPLLGTLFGFEEMQKVALFLHSPENLDALAERIETQSRERRQRGRTRQPDGPAGTPEDE